VGAPEVLERELDGGCLRIQRPAACGGAGTQGCGPFSSITHEREMTRLLCPRADISISARGADCDYNFAKTAVASCFSSDRDGGAPAGLTAIRR
jgi:hypothetical protein